MSDQLDASIIAVATLPLTLGVYQGKSGRTAIYPGRREVPGLVYATMGLTGEAGEIANKVKKILRDDDGVMSIEVREELRKELGDVLWYVAQLATELEIDLGDVGEANLAKLASRAKRGTLTGSGDNR